MQSSKSLNNVEELDNIDSNKNLKSHAKAKEDSSLNVQ